MHQSSLCLDPNPSSVPISFLSSRDRRSPTPFRSSTESSSMLVSVLSSRSLLSVLPCSLSYPLLSQPTSIQDLYINLCAWPCKRQASAALFFKFCMFSPLPNRLTQNRAAVMLAVSLVLCSLVFLSPFSFGLAHRPAPCHHRPHFHLAIASRRQPAAVSRLVHFIP